MSDEKVKLYNGQGLAWRIRTKAAKTHLKGALGRKNMP